MVESEPKKATIIFVKNKSPKLNKQVKKLKNENRDLHDLLIDLDEYCYDQFSKKLIVTMVFRSQAQQDYLYRDSEKYAKKKFKSPHQFWHAFDIRSRIFTKAEQDKIVKYLNKKYNKTNYYKWTAKVHEVGNNGLHFHVQFVRK